MAEADLKINSKIRKVLVENNLDTSALTVSTTAAVVSLRGQLRKLSGREMNDREIVRCLSVLETNILRTKGVKRVKFSVKSWGKKKGKWIKQEK